MNLPLSILSSRHLSSETARFPFPALFLLKDGPPLFRIKDMRVGGEPEPTREKESR